MQAGSYLAQAEKLSAGSTTRTTENSMQGTACLRCRQQKLKCSKTRPICKRCMNMSKSCTYPSPPDRKRLLAQRRRNTESGIVQRAPLLIPGTPLNELTATPSNNSSIAPSNLPSQWAQQRTQSSLFPSSEVALFLIEVYFSRAYNATLLYHKQRFLSDWIAGRLQAFVALSVFATASVFLRNDHYAISSASVSESAHNWQKRGVDWATQASRDVLSQADVPNLETVQACQTLALYWLSLGETKRVYIHVSIAYRVCRLLGIHRSDNVEDDPTTAELRRRCLWACWVTQCISQENACFRTGCWDEIAGLPLPSSESSYLTSDPQSSQYLSATGEVKQLPHTTFGASENQSLVAELAKLAGIWWEIHNFIKRLSSSAAAPELNQNLASWMDIGARLERMEDSLPSLYRGKYALSLDSGTDIENIFSLLCLRHTCVCVVNASIVPLYAPSTTRLKIPKTVVKTAAQEVLAHALSTLNLANELCSFSPDPSKISALTGYCLYFCVYVYQKYSSTQAGARSSSQPIKGAMSILKTLQEQWYSLRTFVSKLQEQLALSEHQGTEAGHRGKANSSQEPDHRAQIPKGLPEVEDYVNEETGTVTRSKNGEFVHNARPGERINSGDSNNTWRQHPTLDQTMGTQKVASDGALSLARGMDDIIRSAVDDNSLNTSESMYSWWEVQHTPIETNVFSGFDFDIMDSTF